MTFLQNPIFIAFLLFYVAYVAVELSLDILNIRYLDLHKSRIPELFVGVYSQEDYQKSIEYTKAKTRFKIITMLVKAAVSFVLILSGFFALADDKLTILIENPLARGVAYAFAIGAVFFVIGLIEGYFYQFVLENDFGFNRMTLKTFVVDQIKGIVLAILFGAPLIAALLWLMGAAGKTWWIYGFALVMGFQLFTAAIYPVWLAPLFNKFTPLNEGPLKTRIESLAKVVNFKMSGIFTIDGSKRSSHSNAFFAGLGAMKRIVLFDTLVEKHSDDEIVAVIAHEMGHNVKKHIQKSLIVSSALMFVLFYVLAFCLDWPLFFQSFGVHEPKLYVGLVLFSLFSSVFMFPITPLFTAISRKNEFEADAFAVMTTKNKEHLPSALVKLTKENLGNLTPHPLYSAYHYSHPTTIERVHAIQAIKI